jgi:hypothetical protein
MTIPSLIMYSIANSTELVQQQFDKDFNSQTIIAYTTLGVLGEPIPSCRKVFENETFSFRCPAGGSIRSIVAYYGQPRGSCSCPLNQLADNSGKCPGESNVAVGAYLVADHLKYTDQKCVPSKDGKLYPCFAGITRYDSECCSSSLDASGFADLGNLSLRLNPSCNSYTLPYIVEAFCLGKTTCSLPVSLNHTISFPLENLRSPALAASVCRSSSKSTCVTDLAFGGLFSGCGSGPKYLLFEGICFASATHPDEANIRASTSLPIIANIMSMQHTDIVFYSSLLDAISILVFIFGVWYMRLEIEALDRLQNNSVCRASDYTIECFTIPPHDDAADLIHQLRLHFETILSSTTPIHVDESIKIADINMGSARYEYIQAACLRGQAAHEVDRVVAKIITRLRVNGFDYYSWDNVQLLNRLKKALFTYERLNTSCHIFQHRAADEINRVYITFETREGFLRCLRTFSSHGLLDRFQQSPDIRLYGEPIILRPAVDPSDVRWENIGVSLWFRSFRVALSTLFMALLLGISYVMIFEALSLAKQTNEPRFNIACSTYKVSLSRDPLVISQLDANTISYNDVLYDHDWQAYNKTNYGSNGYLRCYCEQLNFDKGTTAMKSYKFFNIRTGGEEPWCASLSGSNINAQLATYGATLIIIVVNVSLHQILKMLSVLEYHETETHEVISIALKLCFTQYINTGLLALIIYGDLTNIGVGKSLEISIGPLSFGFFTGSFKDFTAAWYAAVGSSILFTMCFFIGGTQVLVTLQILLKRIMQVADKWVGCVYPFFSKEVTHKDLQVELDQLYVKIAFPFDRHLSSMGTLILVTLTYSATMPFLNAICCVSLFVLYWVNKTYLLRYHSIPPAYRTDLPRVMTSLLYIGAVMHCLVGSFQFGNKQFYDPEFHHIEQMVTVNIGHQQQSFLTATHTWNYAVDWIERITGPNSIVLLLIALIMSTFIVCSTLSSWLFQLFGWSTLDDMFNGNRSWLKYWHMNASLPPYFDTLPITTLRNRINSGVVTGRLLEKYKSRLESLISNEAHLPNKRMEGLETYKLSASQEYSYKFGMDSFHMQRIPPTDWLISKEARADLLFLENQRLTSSRYTPVRNSFAPTIQQSVNFREAFQFEVKFSMQINEILEYCSPMKDDNKIVQRSLNVFCSRSFDNNDQRGHPLLSAHLSKRVTVPAIPEAAPMRPDEVTGQFRRYPLAQVSIDFEDDL